MSVSVRVGVKGSLVIKAKLPLLPDGKGRQSEEAAKESGKDKEERRGVTVVDEKGGGLILACWMAGAGPGDGGRVGVPEREGADRLGRAGMHVHRSRVLQGGVRFIRGRLRARIVIAVLLKAVTWFREEFVVRKC